MEEQNTQAPQEQGGNAKKKSPALLIIILLIIIGAGAVYAYQQSQTGEPDDGSMTEEDVMIEDGMKVPGDEMQGGDEMVVEDATKYKLSDVAQHGSADDCWIAIEGKVYDVTDFIASGNHGGGDAILEGCGLDATELYNTRPMGSGTPHSERARGFLPNFYIGELAQ